MRIELVEVQSPEVVVRAVEGEEYIERRVPGEWALGRSTAEVVARVVKETNTAIVELGMVLSTAPREPTLIAEPAPLPTLTAPLAGPVLTGVTIDGATGIVSGGTVQLPGGVAIPVAPAPAPVAPVPLAPETVPVVVPEVPAPGDLAKAIDAVLPPVAAPLVDATAPTDPAPTGGVS